MGQSIRQYPEMIKKIDIDQLRTGMFIHDLNCGWIDHPFFRSRFRVTDEKQMLKIRQVGVRELYIDTERGSDVAEAPTLTEVQRELELEFLRIATRLPWEEEATSRTHELERARRIQQEAAVAVETLMDDALAGRLDSVAPMAPVVDDIIGSIFRNQDAMIGLSRIRSVDKYAFEHSVNVSVLLVAFARTLGLPAEAIRDLGLGGLLMDAGRILVPRAILNKPERLTDEEFAIMREHVAHGLGMIEGVDGITARVRAVIAEHHERIDGSGYPAGKLGADITQYGQMAAIVDVYDAMTSDRVYHKGQPPHQALRKLLEWSRHHFDRNLVQRFIQCLGVYPIGTLVMLESGRLGVVVESNPTERLLPVVRVVLDTRRRCYLTPTDVDLASPDNASGDRILSVEPPERWRIAPAEFLAQRY